MLLDRPGLSAAEFDGIRRLLFDVSGISIGPGKEALVAGRLQRRLDALGLKGFGEYLQRIRASGNNDELQIAIDLLSTNETYFWREPQHFDALALQAREVAARGERFDVWSAASSSGEEAYSIAMVLEEVARGTRPALGWTIFGSDISQRVLERARRGHYPMERAQRLPQALLHRYCLRGEGEYAGTLLVQRALRERTRFERLNLIEPLPAIGPFDAVFLRNVLIYFEQATKAQVIRAVASRLKPGGRLYVGLSESLHQVAGALVPQAPGVYALPDGVVR
jgi:chemotaxis protein methyltransferase CheR